MSSRPEAPPTLGSDGAVADPERFVVPKEPWLRLADLRASSTEPLLHFAPPAQRTHTFWARSAIYRALRLLGVGPGDEVLVPAYVCAAAVDPIVATGARVVFHGLGADCHADLDDIESRITPATRALLVVHYFGFPQRIGRLRAWCDRRGLLLIEDCAHVLRGHAEGARLGSFGDASVFSWRKFLPLHDGGELVLRRPLIDTTRESAQGVESRVEPRTEPWRYTLKAIKGVVDRAAEATGAAWIEALLSFARRLRGGNDHSVRSAGASEPTAAGEHMSAPMQPPAGALPEPMSLWFDATMAGFPMSRASHRLLMHVDIERAIATRRRNYTYLASRLAAMPGIRLPFPELVDDVCPWVLPVVFNGRDDAHRDLRRLGVPAATWGGVRPALLPHGAFPIADRLYGDIVFLPIHQALNDDHLQTIAGCVARVLNDGAPDGASRTARCDAAPA